MKFEVSVLALLLQLDFQIQVLDQSVKIFGMNAQSAGCFGVSCRQPARPHRL